MCVVQFTLAYVGQGSTTTRQEAQSTNRTKCSCQRNSKRHFLMAAETCRRHRQKAKLWGRFAKRAFLICGCYNPKPLINYRGRRYVNGDWWWTRASLRYLNDLVLTVEAIFACLHTNVAFNPKLLCKKFRFMCKCENVLKITKEHLY